MFPHWFEVLILDRRLRPGRTEWWPALSGDQPSVLSAEKRRGRACGTWLLTGLQLTRLILRWEEGKAQYKLVVQIRILLAYIPCKEVIIYSSDMSHLCRYHGYSVSPANFMKYNQLFTIFCACTCVTKWLFFSSGSPSSLFWWELEPTGIWNPSTAKKLPCNTNFTASDF